MKAEVITEIATGEKVVPNVWKYVQFRSGSTLQDECLAAFQTAGGKSNTHPVKTSYKDNKNELQLEDMHFILFL